MSEETFPDTPGWVFDIDEVSAGVYRVRGTDERGRSVDMTGTNVDLLIAQACEAARKMTGGA